MRHIISKLTAIAGIMIAGHLVSFGQNDLPDVFKKESVPEQLRYLNDHTRIYENYRAIREDMYKSFSRNILDTIAKTKGRIKTLEVQNTHLDSQIDSLKKGMQDASAKLQESISSKNSIRLAGIEVNKRTYNTIMWSILGSLLFLLITGYLTFRLNRNTMLRTRNDLEELKAEFEGYRQKTRLDREQMTRDHFNEVKKLKAR